MNKNILKAVRDWCIGKFQIKGDYLTQIPQGYVTVQELEEIILEMSAGFSFGYTEDGKPGFKEPGGT